MNQTDTTSINGASTVKTAKAPKLGKHAEGAIHYQILTDSERKQPMFQIIGNEGGGYYSKEILVFDDVESCLSLHPPEQPFPSKLLQAVFMGRSSNNAGFLAAILRAEGLLALAPDTEGRHVIAGDWTAWKASMLDEPGHPVDAKPAEKEEKTDANEQLALPSDDEKVATRRGKK
ncbi:MULTISPECIES: hypothetical protein [unclassified Massilia]|uniref:hypothetical protein n=1 Tax=unclassified Massilia TaxID=2609279 RepID=UPI00178628FA|nr:MULTISPECIES: hypothetical protein [unclassified Massilia]MBD8532801.1 hypothetical protein [Massilia sp. CFBP 13647]MBD8676162.1 hypothetical protein [Massilia sp. CFBP 13721]